MTRSILALALCLVIGLAACQRVPAVTNSVTAPTATLPPPAAPTQLPATPTLAPSPTPDWPAQTLLVQGNQLVYEGQPVLLRGVAVGEVTELASAGRDPREEIRYIREEWNANVVRISIHPAIIKHQAETAYPQLWRYTDAALAEGLFVIIDYHPIGFPNGWYQPVPPEWGSPSDLYDSDFELAKGFWDEVSRHYAGENRVLFELWNEPADLPNERYPSQPGSSLWPELKPYWQELIALIRANGADQVILATGNAWAYNLKGIRDDLLADENTAYTWHVYAGHEDNQPDRWAVALDDLETVRPVLVTEWGFQRGVTEHYSGTPEEFAIPFRDQFLIDRGLHSTAWCWIPYYGPPMLEADWRTPTEFGQFVFDYLRQP